MPKALLSAAPGEVHAVLDAAPDPMVVVDREGRVVALNLEAQQFLGWNEPELLGEPMSRFIPTRFHRLLQPAVGASVGAPVGTPPALAPATVFSCFARRRDGSEFPVELARRPLGPGQQTLFLVTLRDLTKWRRAQETRSRNYEQAQATLDAIGDAVITTDTATRITYLNPVAVHLTGWGAEEALGEPLDAVLKLISEVDRSPVHNTATRCLEEGRSVDLEDGVLLVRRDGTEVPIGDSAAPVRNPHGEIVGVVLVIQDEGEKRRVGHRLSFEATHDALTGLINRREFERRLARVMADLAGAESAHVLLCLDLDRFKLINDTCGHDAGDDLLRNLGPLLAGHLRKRDTLARLGGDEFGVLLENCPLAEAERIAEALRSAVELYRFECAGTAFSVGASIGLIPLTADSGGMVVAMRAADAACYAAKEAGGNRVHAERLGQFAAGMSQSAARRVTRLARAADEGQFQLYAQPIVPLQRDSATHAHWEILLRLPDGRGGVQDAGEFLPQAERYSLMPAIDRWVVRESIALLGCWHREHPAVALPVFSINLNASALIENGFLALVEHELARYGLPSSCLCFEIAESAALANLARTTRFLAGMRATGCAVALEDVGSGLMSFTSLRAVGVDFLKIGGDFVQRAADDPIHASIVGAVNQIGRSMGIATIAKQVGTNRVLHKLQALGFDFAQGRALTPPVPLTDAGGRIVMQGYQRSA